MTTVSSTTGLQMIGSREWTPVRKQNKWLVARADGSEYHRAAHSRYTGHRGNVIHFTHWTSACARAGRLNREAAT